MPRHATEFPVRVHEWGFTLIELAIVLFVITLLLGGMLTPLGQQIAERQTGETRRAMDMARTALVGYALLHREQDDSGHLPCPDMRVSGLGGVANDGLEDRLASGRCAAQAGNLPWLTLGLAESDAWGNRLGYAVAQDWAERPATRSELIQVCHDIRCGAPLMAAAVLVSHGRNGLGATNASGGVNLAPTHPEEQENVNGNRRFIMHTPRAADRAGGEFDDLVLPLSPDWLWGRLCDPASLCGRGR
jgi:type II secretory pathway pseudopilin PulG